MSSSAPKQPAPRPFARKQPRLSVLVVLVALAGACGALLRFLLGEIFPEPGMKFPWITFSINVAGSAALGLVTGVVHCLPRTPRWVMPTVGTGFLGSFTTFSAVILAAVPELTGVTGLSQVLFVPPGAFEMVAFLMISMIFSTVAAGIGLVMALAVFNRTPAGYIRRTMRESAK